MRLVPCQIVAEREFIAKRKCATKHLHKIPNTKSQIPNKSQNPKLQPAWNPKIMYEQVLARGACSSRGTDLPQSQLAARGLLLGLGICGLDVNFRHGNGCD